MLKIEIYVSRRFVESIPLCGKTQFVIFMCENCNYARQCLMRRNVYVFVNAHETGCTSSRAIIVLRFEILSRGKVKGNRGLVFAELQCMSRTVKLPHNFGNQ